MKKTKYVKWTNLVSRKCRSKLNMHNIHCLSDLYNFIFIDKKEVKLFETKGFGKTCIREVLILCRVYELEEKLFKENDEMPIPLKYIGELWNET